MKTSKLIVPVAVCLVVMAGCVSTTTGSITEHKRDDDVAAELNYQLGARYYRAGNYAVARDRLLLATQLSPKMAVAYSTLGLTYEALENKRLARASYEKAVRVAPKSFDAQNAFAVFLCRDKDFSQAQKYFEKAAGHAENDNAEVTLTNAGVCMMQKPDVAAAEGFFRAAIDRRPTHSAALLQLCLLKFQEQDYLGARAFVQRFMSVSATTAGVLYLASRIEDMLGNDRGRTEFEDQLIREFPDSPEARKVLGSE